MVLDGTPLRLVSEGKCDSTMESAKTYSPRPTAKVERARRKSRSEQTAQRSKARLSMVARDGTLQPGKQRGLPIEPVAEARQAGAPVRILLVDASEHERRACCVALQRAPFEVDVLEAETGQDGLQTVFHQVLDCILLSNALPDMNSREFMAQLCGDSGDAWLPVLNMADRKSFVELERAVKYGAHDCLVKDAEGHYLDLLPSIVQRMLDAHRNLKGKRQAEAMCRTLIEHIQAITYIMSPQHGNQVTYVSPQIEQLGITPDMWMMNPGLHFQHVHEEDRDAVEETFSHTCRSGEAFCQDYRLRCSNGGVRWFHDTASVVKDHNGHPMFLQGVMVDITNIKEMEAELEEHRYYMERRVAQRTAALEQRIGILESCNTALCNQMEEMCSAKALRIQSLIHGQDLLKPLGGAVTVIDEDGWIVEMNEAAANLLGWESRSAVGHKAEDVILLRGMDVPSIPQMISACDRQAGRAVSFSKALLKYLDGRMALVSTRMQPIRMQEQRRCFALTLTICDQPRWLANWFRGYRPGAALAGGPTLSSIAGAG